MYPTSDATTFGEVVVLVIRKRHSTAITSAVENEKPGILVKLVAEFEIEEVVRRISLGF
jgi:hypothetical protein